MKVSRHFMKPLKRDDSDLVVATTSRDKAMQA